MHISIIRACPVAPEVNNRLEKDPNDLIRHISDTPEALNLNLRQIAEELRAFQCNGTFSVSYLEKSSASGLIVVLSSLDADS